MLSNPTKDSTKIIGHYQLKPIPSILSCSFVRAFWATMGKRIKASETLQCQVIVWDVRDFFIIGCRLHGMGDSNIGHPTGPCFIMK